MNSTVFFEKLLSELKSNTRLQGYYRFLQSKKLFQFRKLYYMQRLSYIEKKITKPNARIWDVGCGYGSTGIFLALNGHKVYGNTLEYYFDEIPTRLKYWKQFGKLDELKLDYTNLFDSPPQEKFDYIIVQDTLHHLEPIDEAIDILKSHLEPGGEIIVVDENGRNLIQRTKLYLQRGNKRIIEIYDERLKKTILLGNENTRSLNKWERIIAKHGLKVKSESVEYNRIYPPFLYKNDTDVEVQRILEKEQKLVHNKLLREYLFFGLSFIVSEEESRDI